MSDQSNGLRSPVHYPPLDGVRGTAILLVMMLHLMVTVPSNPVQAFMHGGAEFGWAGVDLFFVLSGFLITGILIDTVGSKTYFSRFYIRRIARIFPLFYGLAIFSFLILPSLPYLPPEKLARYGTVGDDQILYWVFLSNFAIAKAGVFRHGIMDVTWSLSIEEQFYLTWPFVVMLFRNRLVAVCAILFALSLGLRLYAVQQGWNYNAIYVLPYLRLEGLATGAIVATLVRNETLKARLPVWFRNAGLFGMVGFVASAFVDGTFMYYDAPTVTGLGFSFLALMFGGLVGYVYVRPSSGGARFFSGRFLGFIGKISFALYLFHLPIRAAVRDLWLTPQWINTTPLFGVSGQVLFYIVSGGIAILVLWLSYHLYEKHFLEWGRRLTS